MIQHFVLSETVGKPQICRRPPIRIWRFLNSNFNIILEA